MAVFGLTSQNLAPSLRAKSNKSSRRCSSWVAQVAPCSHGVLWGLHFSRSRTESRFPMRLQAGQGPRQKLATTSRICSECQQLILLNKIEFHQRCWSCKIIKTWLGFPVGFSVLSAQICARVLWQTISFCGLARFLLRHATRIIQLSSEVGLTRERKTANCNTFAIMRNKLVQHLIARGGFQASCHRT